jgi:hypothetical protein
MRRLEAIFVDFWRLNLGFERDCAIPSFAGARPTVRMVRCELCTDLAWAAPRGTSIALSVRESMMPLNR